MGGKYKLARRIVPQIPEHTCYCEPFAGAAWVLFYKEPSKVEVLNDINADVANLYRVLQWHPEEFLRQFRWALVSREEFRRQLKLPAESLTDIHRAVRFFYLHRTGFGGNLKSPSFGTSASVPPKLNLLRIEEELSAAHVRLSGAFIENLPYADLIKRYDRPDTFFYIDPPYWGVEDTYGEGVFERKDFSELADLLMGIKGKLLVSLNDRPEVRKIFKGFALEAVATRYTCGKSNRTRAAEVFIKNF
jgi:DNA adenine methylase